ncbi:hypothetical protein RJG79_08075 [Mycoplasmatota bacterium WC44]
MLIKKILYLLITLLVLTGCSFPGAGIPHGKSIEDCMEIGHCYYINKNVKNEESELSDKLKMLLINEKEDDIYFGYSINPGGDNISIRYISGGVISHNSLDELVDVFINAQNIVDELYDVDEVNFTGLYDDSLGVNITLDEEGRVKHVHFDFDYKSNNEIYADKEADIIEYLEVHFEKVKICLDYDLTNSIFLYGHSLSYIRFYKEVNFVRVTRESNAKSDSIDERILELYSDYNIVFYDPAY